MEKGSQSVGIVEVTRDNWQRIRPAVLEAIENASFVAIDTEFSGLGDDKKGRLAKYVYLWFVCLNLKFIPSYQTHGGSIPVNYKCGEDSFALAVWIVYLPSHVQVGAFNGWYYNKRYCSRSVHI